MRESDEAEYRLNEAQTLLLCMRGNSAECAEIRREIIAVFQAAMTGAPIPCCPHWDKLAIGFKDRAPQISPWASDP
jgi:hypothetical protein